MPSDKNRLAAPEKSGASACRARPRRLMLGAGLALACLTLFPVPASAGSADSENPVRFEWHGFGTLGLARSSSDQADFVRDLSQWDGSHGDWTANLDSVFGLQANVHFSEQFEAVIQGVSRYRYDGSYRPELSWAFVKFNPSPNLTLRGGRLGTEFYLRADSRLVGYSALSVRPPGDYFGGLPFYHVDGLDIQATHPLGDGLLRGKLFTGLSHEKLPVMDHAWDLDGSRMSGGHLDYLSGPWQWRLSYAQIRFNQELPLSFLYDTLNAAGFTDVARSLGVAGKTSRYLSFGGVYDSGPWQLHLMLSRVRQESDIYENGRAGYLLAGYRIGEFTPYLGYSWWKTTSKAVSGSLPPPLATLLVAPAMAESHSDQKTFSLGLRWDFQENLALKAQWDRVRGTPDSIFPYRGEEQAGWKGDTDVFSLALDFIF